MELEGAYEYLNKSSCSDIMFDKAAEACIDFARESESVNFSSEGEADSIKEADDGAKSVALGLSDEERSKALSDFYREKRIRLLRAFCTSYVAKAQAVSEDIVKENKRAARKKDAGFLERAPYMAHQVLMPTRELALFMADIDLTCINGLYLACTRIQKKLGPLSRRAAKDYNEGKIYSEQIGQKADIKTRNYSLLDMFMYPSGKKPDRKRD